jgi:hypothetical protein
MISPDPVADAAAYQRHLLAALGDDDAAVAQAESRAVVRRLIQGAGESLRDRPAETEWSVLECIGHIADAEIVYAGRYRWILAHEEPELIGYDQDRWVAALGHRDDDPDSLLSLFEALRGATLELWRRTKAEGRARVGIHRERGPESYELSFRLIAGHDRVHLAQAQRALEAVRGG